MVSRKLSYAGEFVSSSRWFSASMVRPDMFACLFDRENSRYRQEPIYGLVFNAGGFELLKKTSWAIMEDFPGK